ncbi:MAG: type IV secretory system conjugative DNA transfer family protein, partial [Patescibacteria group bacterium]
MSLILPFVLGVSGLGLVGALRSASTKRKAHPPGVFSDGVLLEIRVPKGNEKDPLAAENMFASLHGLLRVDPTEQEHISFEIASDSTGIHFYVWCPSHLKDFISGQIYAQYPSAEVRLLERDYMQEDLAGLATCGENLVLTKESFFPLRTFRDFEVDPMAAVTGAMSEIKEGERIWLQILVRPVPDNWQAAGHQYAQEVKTGIKKVKLGLSELIRGTVSEVGEMIPHAVEQFTNPAAQAARISKGAGPAGKTDAPRLSPGQELELKMIEDKLTRVGFAVSIRVFTAALESNSCQDLLRGATASFRQFSVANLNSLDKSPVAGGIDGFKRSMASREFPAKPYILDTAELASLFHLPNISVETPAIAWATYKKGEPPANIPTSDCTYFAQTTFRERLTKFGIKNHTDDRRKHMYLIGKTGTGKSTIFKNMIVQDIQNGEGVAVLDPHGDLVKDLLDFIPPERIKDVVY